MEPRLACYSGQYSSEAPSKDRGNLPAHKFHILAPSDYWYQRNKSLSASKAAAFGNQGEIWKLLTKGNISTEKLLGASKLEVEKYQSTGGFYATVAKTLKENIV